MTTTLLLAVGAMLSGALSDLFYRKAQMEGIRAGGFLALQATIFALILWTYILATGQLSHAVPATWLYGLPAGAIGYLGLLLFVRSLRTGSAGVNVPIFRLSFVITAVGGVVLLGEPAVLAKLVGTVLAITSVLSLLDLGALSGGKAGSIGGGLLLATVCFGVVGVMARKAAMEGSPTVPLMAAQTIPFTASALGFALLRRDWDLSRPTLRYAPLVALFQLGWNFMLLESLQRGQASISYPIVQLSFVVTAALAVVFLSEPLTTQKVRGLGLAILAVLAFAFS